MKKVILYTREYEFVVSGWIPTFTIPPDVIVWGDRVFRYDGSTGVEYDTYVECFAVALVKVD